MKSFFLAACLALTATLAHAIEFDSIALDALADGKSQFGLDAQDIEDVRVTDLYASRHNGVRHVWLRQHIDGLPVVNGVANVNIEKSGKVINLHSRMASVDFDRRQSAEPAIDALAAIAAYANNRGIDVQVQPQLNRRQTDGAMLFSGGDLSRREIPANLAWYALPDGKLILVWEISVEERASDDWMHAFIDARSGELVQAINWTQDAGYKVFAEPLENPAEGPETLVVDPADDAASPLGWHDDGTNSFTDTRGNNVLAQDDLDADNVGGSRPDGGASLVFDFPLDLDTQAPPQYLDFAITNLFYWNNLIHDVLWHFGFDEPAGNFQTDNFENGGEQGDAVIADAQDGSGTNNANFSTPPDGFSGRMQMFVWTGFNPATLRVDAPSSAAGDYVIAPGSFGGTIGPVGTTADLELVSDGTAFPEEACSALQAFTPGNIALIRRGGCAFVTKVLNAQDAGAVAAIIINNQGGNSTTIMGGTGGGSVTIPAAMIGTDNGNNVVAGLPASGSMLDEEPGPLDRDSDLDAGIIAHEYGHGLSIRLTGGASNSSCLFGVQQAGEGWSDFLGLWLTAKASDSLDKTRGVGSYVLYRENIPGAGIRPAPYTRDMTVNPLVYESVNNVSIPHGVGTVFASALWDMYLNLVEKYGFDENFIGGNGGNHIALQLVIDGLKLQPCLPTFLDARDAILQADQINSNGDNQCEIWNAFGRRGMGLNADDGGNADTLSVTNGFHVPEACGPMFANGFESAGAP